MNPYEPPAPQLDLTRRGVTLLPKSLSDRTRRIVMWFGLAQFVWPLVVAYWTDSVVIDIWAIFIASNGTVIRRGSFKRFPWTALMCCVYPVILIVSMSSVDVLDFWNWIPSRSSPNLFLQLVSSVWAGYAVVEIVRCYFWHRRVEHDSTPESDD